MDKQEPVAWITDGGEGELWWYQSSKFDEEGNLIGPNPDDIPLYTAPPKKEWVGLSDEESKPLIQKAMMYYGHNPDHWTITAGAGFCILAKAIEAKLKEKNT